MTHIMADEKEIKNKAAQNQINIELTEEIAEGIYSNLAMIAHSNSEFVIDFIRLMLRRNDNTRLYLRFWHPRHEPDEINDKLAV